ncbi:hypothetical protein SG34_000255 [Thalassomonas viridans]|uniref:Uncharacterized protein n=1 Tax=Thalassomonas viridans TaxID=137584 RepID=A0AAE9Z3J5_9GAMM|nr:hypothetical protein [Thalassomonas viridans]WDE05420.1 hypothetical protein SG34_000255 [Thalassomonas viridans]
MKFKSSTLACSLLLTLASAQSFALDQSRTWYAGTLGNSAVIETSVGCIDQDMMWEKHVIKANAWDNQWFQSRDYEWTFAIYNTNRSGAYLSGPEFVLDTSRLHDASGSTVDAQGNDLSVTFYTIRPYEPMTSVRERNDTTPYNMIGYMGLDAECDFN